MSVNFRRILVRECRGAFESKTPKARMRSSLEKQVPSTQRGEEGTAFDVWLFPLKNSSSSPLV